MTASLACAFLDTLDALTADVVMLMKTMSRAELLWVSANRDFGEDERYRAKDEVDDSLLKNSLISEERSWIEALFSGDDPLMQYGQYLDRLDTVLWNVHRLLLQPLRDDTEWGLGRHASFWDSLAPAADRDNAHAMYLSSGNWDFSVFNPLIDRFDAWTDTHPDLYEALLTAGTQDVRTAAYSEFGTTYYAGH